MSNCKCGFSQEYPKCDGSHKIVKKVRKSIADKIQEIEIIDTNQSVMTHPRVVKAKALAIAEGE